MRSDRKAERALAHALDALADTRRNEIWDHLLAQLTELAEKESFRRQRAARFSRQEAEREREWEVRAA